MGGVVRLVAASVGFDLIPARFFPLARQGRRLGKRLSDERGTERSMESRGVSVSEDRGKGLLGGRLGRLVRRFWGKRTRQLVQEGPPVPVARFQNVCLCEKPARGRGPCAKRRHETGLARLRPRIA